MTDLIGDALRKKDANEREKSQKRYTLQADALARANALAEKAHSAMIKSIEGVASLPNVSGSRPTIMPTIIDGRPGAMASILAIADGPELSVKLDGRVGWCSGDGFNIGLGVTPPIRVTVTRKRDRRSTEFAYPVNEGVSVSGHYGIDPVSMQMKISAAISRL